MAGATLFHNGSGFYPTLEKEIVNARREILMNVYSFEDDSIGRRIVRLLKQKIGEGLAVRVILDGLGSRNSGKEIVRALGGNPDVIRVFRPRSYLRAHPLRFLRRNHARLFLMDRSSLAVGGICIGKTYETREDLSMTVPVTDASMLIAYFDRLWEAAGAVDACSHASRVHEPMPVNLGVAGLVSTPLKEERFIYRWTLEAINAARDCMTIVSPWFFPTIELLRSLAAARERGVRVTIITPLRTDKPWYDTFRAGALPKLIARGALWYAAPNYFHQKFFVVDDAWCLGSANFDMVSMNRNYELNLAGRGGRTLEALDATIDRLIGESERMERASGSAFETGFFRSLYPVLEAMLKIK